MKFSSARKMLFSIVILVLICPLLFPFSSMNTNAETLWEEKKSIQDVPLNKEWTITFNKDVDISSLNNNNIYVLNSSNNKVETSILLVNDGNQVLVQPPEEGYQPNSSYTLYVNEDVYSKNKSLLKTPVKMKFSTGTKNVEEESFIPREDSSNTVKLLEETRVLSNELYSTLITPSYLEKYLIFKGSPKELKNIRAGEIIILPPTDDYPYGYAKEIISIEYEETRTILHTTEPEIEEVFEDIDISDTIPIEADDMTLDPEVYPNIINEEQKGNERIYTLENPDGEIDSQISIGMDGKDIYVRLKEVHLLPNDPDLEQITINGKFTLTTPTINLDHKRLNLNKVELSTGLEKKLNVKFTKNGKEKEFRQKLGIPIHMKLYGMFGLEIQFYLVMTSSGEVYLDFEIVNGIDIKAGMKKTDDEWKGFNKSKLTNSMEVGVLKGNLESKLGLSVELDIQALQFSLGAVEVMGGYKASISGEVSTENSCLKKTDEIFLEASGRIGPKKKNIGVELPGLSKTLTNQSTCNIIELQINSIELKPGESKTLTVKGKDILNRQQIITLPDDSITFSSTNKDIATVNKMGKVTANNNIKTTSTQFIEVVYKVDAFTKVTAEVPVVIRSGETIIQDQLKKLNDTVVKGYETSDIFSARLSGNDLPEIIATYSKMKSYSYDNLLRVYRYNTNLRNWELVKTYTEKESDSPFILITKGNLTEYQKEHVVLGTIGGSGGYLSPFILGSTDAGKVQIQTEFTDPLFSGDAFIKNKELLFTENLIVSKKYQYVSGKFKEFIGSGADDQKLAESATHFITLEKKNGKTVVNGERNIQLKVGESLAIVRKNQEDKEVYPIRTFTNTDIDVLQREENSTLLIAKKKGSTILSIETEAYSGDFTEFKINVK